MGDAAATSPNKVSLETFQLRQLLTDIELNEARHQKGFREVCNANQSFYGEPGSALRAAFLEKLDLLKRRRIKGYLTELRKVGVAPCYKTLQEAKRAKVLTGELLTFVKSFDHLSYLMDSSSDSESSGNYSSSSASEDDSKHSGQFIGAGDDLLSTTSTPSKKTKKKERSSSSKKKSSTGKQKKSPVQSLEQTTMNFKKLDLYGNDNDTTSEANNTGVESTASTFTSSTIKSASIGSLRFYNSDGSAEAPHIHFVHPNKPEAHEAFFILYLPKYSHGTGAKKFIRDIVEIRRSIPIPDVDHWMASIPTYEDGVQFSMDPSLSGRVVLVKGPSVDCHNRKPKTLNDRLFESCGTAADLRVAAMTAIEDKKNQRSRQRNTAHYLFVFPPGTVLDNTAFSGTNSNELKRTFAGLRDEDSPLCPKIDPNDPDSLQETLHGMVVCFQAALKGGLAVDAEDVAQVDTVAYLAR